VRACDTCRELVRSEPGSTRAERIDRSCPDCACEHGFVGALADAKRVDDKETLYSVIVTPPDMEEGQLIVTTLTQAERQGLSVLRGDAANEEFIEVARQRKETQISKGLKPVPFGVAEFSCASVRMLRADANSPGRAIGAKLFCIYDCDIEQLPYHAEIFQTWPRGLSKSKSFASLKSDRRRLLAIVSAAIIPATIFRGGILAGI
jgi:hypothetical protein